MPNEAVEKLIEGSSKPISGGSLDPSRCDESRIQRIGEVDFCSLQFRFSGRVFLQRQRKVEGCRASAASRSNAGLGTDSSNDGRDYHDKHEAKQDKMNWRDAFRFCLCFALDFFTLDI